MPAGYSEVLRPIEPQTQAPERNAWLRSGQSLLMFFSQQLCALGVHLPSYSPELWLETLHSLDEQGESYAHSGR